MVFVNLKSKHTANKGAALLMVILFFLFISLVAVLILGAPVAREFSNAQRAVKSTAAYFLAEAGNEDAYYRIKNSMQLSPTEVLSLGGVYATTTIVDLSDGKEITSDGEDENNIRRVRTTLSTSVTGVDFFYGAQVGEGGLVMQQNTEVKGASGSTGSVYSNGPISGAGSSKSTITGDGIVASGITEDVTARSTVCNQDQEVGHTSPQIDFAQSFSPGDTQPLAKVSLYIKKNGNPGSRTVYIVSDNAGSPSTTSLASATLDRNLVGTNYAWTDVVFSSPATLTAGQTYWIVLDASQNNSNYWIWCKDSNNGFGNGVGKYKSSWNSGGSWTSITGDLSFKIFLGSGISSLTSVRVLGDGKANTITSSFIGGDAYYQSISGTTVGGASYPGSADPSILAMPISDANVADWKSDAQSGGIIAGNCPGASGCATSMGPTKINGNLTVSGGVNLLITGTVYVTGNITVGNNSSIGCDPSYGDKSCVVLADGWINANNNVTFSGSGHPDSYLLMLSLVSNCNGGSQNSWCAPQNSAIYLSNNATGALFYAANSEVYISNNVDVTSVVGYKLYLENNASITYEIGVADLDFSSGPGGGWKVNEWKEIE